MRSNNIIRILGLSAIFFGVPAGLARPDVFSRSMACWSGWDPRCQATSQGVPNGPFISSSISHHFQQADYFSITSAAGMDIQPGRFQTFADTSGYTEILANGSNSVSGTALGQILDQITISGSNGAGQLVIPVQLTGDIDVGYSVGGLYSLGPLASSSLQFLCFSTPVGGFGIPCDGTEMFVWNAPAPLARTMTLIFPFTFGVPFELSLQVTLTSAVGYAANGETGLLTGHAFANLLSTGVFGAATVYDQFGQVHTPTIASDSRFDYLAGFVEPVAVPEPVTSMVVASGLIALAAWNRKRIWVRS